MIPSHPKQMAKPQTLDLAFASGGLDRTMQRCDVEHGTNRMRCLQNPARFLNTAKDCSSKLLSLVLNMFPLV